MAIGAHEELSLIEKYGANEPVVALSTPIVAQIVNDITGIVAYRHIFLNLSF